MDTEKQRDIENYLKLIDRLNRTISELSRIYDTADRVVMPENSEKINLLVASRINQVSKDIQSSTAAIQFMLYNIGKDDK